MEKLFISYELALLAKEKGFNDPCIAEYWIGANKGNIGSPKNPLFNMYPDILDEVPCYNSNILKNYVAAPIYQQVIDWLRKEHKMGVEIELYCEEYTVYVKKVTKNISDTQIAQEYEFDPVDGFFDYYEALNYAVTEALNHIKP